jgi:HEAT repeat protein
MYGVNSTRTEKLDTLEKEKKLDPDKNEIKKANEVLKSFQKAFTALKIYPLVNPSVQNSIDTFISKIKEFLEKYGYLKISVGEFSFSYKGELAFQDQEKKRSLPFLFFKDGMRELTFFKGADEKELQEFLKVIKEDSDLPPEDSDIVNSLWEKDFVHIRYFAIDEFLESDIEEEKNKIYVKVDKNKFSEGRINITPEDRIELYKRGIALGIRSTKGIGDGEDGEGAQEDGNISQEDLTLPSQIASISKAEIPEVKSMLAESRAASRLTELVNLLVEILFLEERHDRFLAILNVLNQCFLEIIHKSDFALALFYLNRIQELKEFLPNQQENNKKSLERFIEEAKDATSVSRLKKLFLDGRIKNFDSFFQYIKFLGSSSIPILGDIWENSEDALIRQKASELLQELGQKDIAALVNIAEDDRVSLTKEVITILGRIGDKKVIPYLENFATHKDKTICLVTIDALKKIEDEAVNKILFELLHNEHREVRAMAAASLKYHGDITTLDYVIELVRKKDFKKRSKTEKRALLKFLAKSQRVEVGSLLRSFLKKWSILSKSLQNEIRLAAVYALEAMANPDAIKILKEGTRVRNKAIRRACEISLRKLTV